MQEASGVVRARVGWIGIGKMGSPMVRSLLADGYAVSVSEPLPENRASAVAAGASLAESIGDLVQRSDVVVTTVTNEDILRDIVFSGQGLVRHMRAGQVFIDMSTISPDFSAEIAAGMAAIAVDYLRAPVSGSSALALEARLTVMVSGPRSAWRRVDPLLRCFATRQFWVGEADEARFLKLAINVLVAGTSALLSEAVAVGRRGGVELVTLLDVICDSPVGSPLLHHKRDVILADDYDPSFSVEQMTKDLALICDVAEASGLDVELTDHIRRRFERAGDSGLADQDYFVLVRDRIGGNE